MIVAEPFAEASFPGYEWTRRLESLTRRLDRRSGMTHNADITARELSGMLPADGSVEFRAFAPRTLLPAGEALALIDRAARGEPLAAADSQEKDAILKAAEAGLLSPAGSIVAIARRHPE